ncbi:MAG: ScpA family protein [Bdellovibrionales bacterium]
MLSLAGFEGPIDLLLNLAREQKVDLANISILPLAEQFLEYVATARKLRLEIAADYLVMAAWLAYLKSRLLLPEPEAMAEQQDAAKMAEALRFQLQRLEAMQRAAQDLWGLPQLDSEVFLRGAREPLAVEERPKYYLPYQDLLLSLGACLRRHKSPSYEVKRTRLYSLEESLERLRRLIGKVPDWSVLRRFLPAVLDDGAPLEHKSALASTFAATLEMVKNGEIELRQDGSFGPIYLKFRENPVVNSLAYEGVVDD